jgi:hypothetical protein
MNLLEGKDDRGIESDENWEYEGDLQVNDHLA